MRSTNKRYAMPDHSALVECRAHSILPGDRVFYNSKFNWVKAVERCVRFDSFYIRLTFPGGKAVEMPMNTVLYLRPSTKKA